MSTTSRGGTARVAEPICARWRLATPCAGSSVRSAVCASMWAPRRTGRRGFSTSTASPRCRKRSQACQGTCGLITPPLTCISCRTPTVHSTSSSTPTRSSMWAIPSVPWRSVVVCSRREGISVSRFPSSSAVCPGHERGSRPVTMAHRARRRMISSSTRSSGRMPGRFRCGPDSRMSPSSRSTTRQPWRSSAGRRGSSPSLRERHPSLRAWETWMSTTRTVCAAFTTTSSCRIRRFRGHTPGVSPRWAPTTAGTGGCTWACGLPRAHPESTATSWNAASIAGS